MIPFIILFLVFACWGSFLNVIACRLMQGSSILRGRSCCPHCKQVLAWYDLIPVISWLMLSAKCRSCKVPISYLYPCIELLTAVILTLLVYYVPEQYVTGYLIFFSALMVTMRTDIEYMLISQLMSVYLIPVGVWLSMMHLLPISATQSIVGAIFGYGSLYVIAYLFTWYTGKEGLGRGDMELMAGIGSFIGPHGCWMTLLLASIVGSCVGITYMLVMHKSRSVKIPFGPFLALGAMAYVLWPYISLFI